MLLNLNLGDFYAIMTALCWSCGVIFFEIAGRSLSTLQISLLKNIVGVIGFILFILLQEGNGKESGGKWGELDVFYY